jgi:hypothetical protein
LKFNRTSIKDLPLPEQLKTYLNTIWGNEIETGIFVQEPLASCEIAIPQKNVCAQWLFNFYH